MVHTQNMPKKPKTKRCIVYMPDDLYYKLASSLKRHPHRELRSVSAYFRECARDRKYIIPSQNPHEPA